MEMVLSIVLQLVLLFSGLSVVCIVGSIDRSAVGPTLGLSVGSLGSQVNSNAKINFQKSLLFFNIFFNR